LDEFTALGYAPYFTRKEGVQVCLGGTGSPLLLGAHVDTLGAMVRQILPTGRLRVAKVGGLVPANVDTANVTVHTRGGTVVTGTFQLEDPAVHVNSAYAETVRTFDNLEVVLDEVVKSEADVRALGIDVGDYVCVDPRFVVTPTGFIKSRFLDDKLSAAILLAYAKYLRDENVQPARKTYINFTVFEEVGHGGAAIPEDVQEVIAVDMGCVGKGLQCDETMVSICVMDSRGPSSRSVVDGLVSAARSAGVRYALDVYPHYGSDADAALAAGHDVRHCTVGAGVAASHGYERSHIEGLAGVFDLLCEYVGKA
jgi:putative aminopeptidase FrvX